MREQMRLNILNIKGQLPILQEVNSRFLENVSQRPDSKRFQSQLGVDNERLVVDCFGYTATTSPRVVLTASGLWAMEHVFYAELGETKLELWRFYLGQGGQIHQCPNEESVICDYDSEIIADHICGQVLKGALESPLFEPS